MEPATISQEIFAELDSLMSSAEVNPFRLRQIQSRAHKLIEADAVQGHMLLGMASCLGNDSDAMKHHFEIANRLAPSSVQILSNYAVALISQGFMDEAVAHQNEALQVDPSDRTMQKKYVATLAAAGRFREANQHIDPSHRDLPGDEQSDQAHGRAAWLISQDDIATSVQLMDQFDLTDEHCSDCVNLVHSVLHDNGYYYHWIDCEVARDESDVWIDVTYRPAGIESDDQLNDINGQLIDTFVESSLAAFDYGILIARIGSMAHTVRNVS